MTVPNTPALSACCVNCLMVNDKMAAIAITAALRAKYHLPIDLNSYFNNFPNLLTS